MIIFQPEPGKENSDLVRSITEKISEQVDFCMENKLETEIFGKKIKFDSDIKMTQIDHKIRQLQCGLGGAFCTCCDFSKDECNNIDQIKLGFPITRDLVEIQAMYDKLVSEGRLKKASSDEREGVTAEPMLNPNGYLKPHQFGSILHWRLNTLRWCSIMGHHYNIRDNFEDGLPVRGLGKAKTPEEKEALKLSEAIWQAQAKKGILSSKTGN